jgi:hypothetical protein
MLYDFLVLINVNPQVAGRVVLFPCQSPDWENYAGDEEMMIPGEDFKVKFQTLLKSASVYMLDFRFSFSKRSVVIKEMYVINILS